MWSSRKDRFQVAVVKERGPGISQSKNGVEPGPARADKRFEVEGVVSPLSLRAYRSGALWSGGILEEAVDICWPPSQADVLSLTLTG